MTRQFCTLFDSNYVFKAIAMHQSLLTAGFDFHLTCFCFDDDAKDVVDALGLPRIATVSLAQLEAFDNDLASVKERRTPVEYCWTATPSLPRYVFTQSDVTEVTYLDADLFFFSDPEPLFEEMGDCSVLITPHRYSPEYAHQIVNGIYNVQFLVFRRDADGDRALSWWHERCIEWCYYRLEDGKLGDQKYLDDWPEQFSGVHVLSHKGGGLAPWNISQYDIQLRDGHVLVDDDPLIFFHYHRVQMRKRGSHAWEPPGYRITQSQRELIYDPYLDALDRARGLVSAVRPQFRAGLTARPPLRQRVVDARAKFGERAVSRFPFLLRIRYPLRGMR